MSKYLCSVSATALAAVMLAGSLNSSLAADVTVPAGEAIVVGDGVDPIEVVGPDKLTVEQNASVEGIEESPVYISGSGAVIDNSGKIFTADGEESAVYVNAGGADVDINITNNANGVISSVGESTLLGKGTGSGSVTLDNYGSIIAHLVEGQDYSDKAIDFHDFKGTSGSALLYVTINNYEGGLIEAEGHDAVRLGKENVVAVVNNWGTIISSGSGGGSNDGIDLQDKLGSRTINNYETGLIQGSQHGIHGKVPVTIVNYGEIAGETGSGINIDGPGDLISVTNYGTVTGGKVGGGDGDGIDIDRRLLLENYGRVEGLNGLSAEGLAIGGGTINNYSGSVIFGEGRGILADDSDEGPAPFATTVYNEGLIEAGTFDAIQMIGNQADTIINKGTIRAGTSGLAIDMGGGYDTLTLFTGSVIEGIADGGAGGNLINLEGSGDGTLGSNFYRFAWVNVNSGNWTTELGGVDYRVNDNGTLIVDSEVAAPSTIEVFHGRLDAKGELAQLYVYGGTLAINGSDIGQLTITENFSFDGDVVFNEDYSAVLSVVSPVLEVTVAADGRSDLLTVSDENGTAQLSLYNGEYQGFSYGPHLKIEALAGNYAEATTYHIVHVDGTISGDGFLSENISVDFAFLDASLNYEPSDIFLTLVRNDTQFWDVAETTNQKLVAQAIGAAGGSGLHNEIVTMNVGEAQGAFDQLSGESHASSMGTQVVQANLVTDTIQNRFGFAFTGAGNSGPGFPEPQYLGASEKRSAAHGKSQARGSGWIKGYGEWLSLDGDGNAASVDGAVGGVLGGYDVVTKDAMFGLAAGYAQATTDVDSRLASVDTDTFQVVAYGAVMLDRYVKVSGGASYGWSSSDSERMALGDQLTASYDGNVGIVFGEVAYLARMGASVLEPFAGATYIDVDQDGFAETGGIGALTSDGQSFSNTASTVGFRLAYDAASSDGMRVTPRASLAWRHAFGDVTPDAVMSFADTGTSFTVDGAPIAEDSLIVGAGIEMGLSEGVTLGFDYTGSFAEEATSNAGKAVGRVAF